MQSADESLRRVLGVPDQVETRLGALTSLDGVPSAETAETVYDHLYFVHALNAYLDGFAEHRRMRSGTASRRPASRTTRSSSSPS